jgi:RNase P/RNase MRP subunit p30
MRDFFIGKRNKKIEKKGLALGLDFLFVKEVSKISDLKKIKQEIKNYDAILIKTESIEIMRRIIDKASDHFSEIIVLGTNDVVNRTFLEHKKTTALLSPEYRRRKDFINYRNSGLNQVLCKIAKENGKTIIENFSDIFDADKKTKSIILGRIMQNAKLCKKYKTKFILRNFTNNEQYLNSSHELNNFERILL